MNLKEPKWSDCRRIETWEERPQPNMEPMNTQMSSAREGEKRDEREKERKHGSYIDLYHKILLKIRIT